MRSTSMLLVPLLLAACATPGSNVYIAAVADPTRPEAARDRDAYRKPAEVLAFSGLSVGDAVVEIAPGGGYYTAILSRVVGETGRIYAVDPERLFQVFERGREGFPAYAKEDPQANVVYGAQNLDEIDVPSGIDQVWMVLYYHDTLWTGEDRARMNARLYDALKPGGVYLVIDHSALPGAEPEVGRTLHRMDRAIALREIEGAGFELVSESAMFANPSDPRDDSVFDDSRRGKTDRFALLFRKPR